MDRSAKLRLSIQRALLGAIGPSVRGVAIGWTDDEITIRAIIDGEIDEDDKESIEVAGSEVISDFPELKGIREECVRLDYPAKLSLDEMKCWVYLRKED